MKIDSGPSRAGEERARLDRLAADIAALEERMRSIAEADLSVQEKDALTEQWRTLNSITIDLERRLGMVDATAPVEVHPTIAPLPVPPSVATSVRRPRAAMAAAGRVTTILGVLLALFLVFEFVISDLSEARSQRALLDGFKQTMVGGGAVAAAPEDAIGQETTIGQEGEEVAAAPAGPFEGDPVALLQIPALGLEKVVVEGTGAEETKKGPGHLIGSSQPGEVGKVVIAGRRTTYGAPFGDLDLLEPGDEILTTTPKGRFTYEVTEIQAIASGDPDVFEPAPDENLLVLATSDPEFTASGRLVALAELQGVAVSLPSSDPVMVDEEASGLAGDTRASALVILWAQLLLVAVVLTFILYRRWPPVTTYVVTTPIALALVFLLFENADRLLPSTL